MMYVINISSEYNPFIFHSSDTKKHSIQSFSRVRFFVTPRTAAHQVSLSIINSQSLLKLMSINSKTLEITIFFLEISKLIHCHL